MALIRRSKRRNNSRPVRRPSSTQLRALNTVSSARPSLQSGAVPQLFSAIGATSGGEQSPKDVALAYMKPLLAATRAQAAYVYFRNEENGRMESLAILGRSDALTSQVSDRLAAQVVNDGKTAAINQHRAVPMVRRRTLDGILISLRNTCKKSSVYNGSKKSVKS